MVYCDPLLDLYVAYYPAKTSFLFTVNSSLVFMGGHCKKKPGGRFIGIKGQTQKLRLTCMFISDANLTSKENVR
jgi:hypothetical protein